MVFKYELLYLKYKLDIMEVKNNFNEDNYHKTIDLIFKSIERDSHIINFDITALKNKYKYTGHLDEDDILTLQTYSNMLFNDTYICDNGMVVVDKSNVSSKQSII